MSSPQYASRVLSGITIGRLTFLGREIGAGVTVACVALPICIAAGVLAYVPLGPHYIARGAAAGIFCAVAGGIAGALARSSSFITIMPSTPAGLVQASFAGALLTAVHGDTALAAAAVPLCLLLAGMWQALFALSGVARIIKFTPFPVVAGFVSGIALLILFKQIPALLGVTTAGQFAHALSGLGLPRPFMSLFGISLVVVMLVVGRVAPRVPAIVAGLAIGVIGFHLVHGLEPDIDLGPTVGTVPTSASALWSWFDRSLLSSLVSNAGALQILMVSSLTLALLGTLDMLMALRTAQSLGDITADPRRELFGQSLGNAVSAFTGSAAVSPSISLLSANYRAGGRTRVSTISASLTLLLGIALFPRLVSSLPMAVLSAILVVLGIRLFDRWSLGVLRDALAAREKGSRSRARRNAAIVLAVMSATALGQPAVGAATGIALACLLFIMDMSRPVIRRRFRGNQIFSKRVRSRQDSDILRTLGVRVVVLELQGVLFFGNADDLANEIRNLDERIDTVILDLRRVGDIDTSGAAVLQQIAQRLRNRKRRLVVCGAGEAVSSVIRTAIGQDGTENLFPDLDTALECMEERTLRDASADRSRAVALRLDRIDLVQDMSTEQIRILEAYLENASYGSGTILCREGEPSDRLWILTHGSVSVWIAGDQGERRLTSLGTGTTVGEMGLLEREPRSARVVADEDVECFVLKAEAYDALLRDHPSIGHALLANIAKDMAHRLRVTNEDLRLANA